MRLQARLVGILGVGLVLSGLAPGVVSETPEERTAHYLASIHQNPSLLLPFLRDMPKGGDLHIHLAGAIYAEKWIDYAAQDNLCVDRSISALLPPPCDNSCAKYTNKPAARCAYQDHVLYNQLVDAWSMRNWNRSDDSGHDHFFATFDKFDLASLNSVGNQLAEVAGRAAADHLQYLELMHTADGMQAAELGLKLGWNDDFGQLRETLLSGGLREIVTATRKQLDHDEATQRQLLRCGSPQADPGCAVSVRYLYQVLRGLPPPMVFAQIVLGFELAKEDPRFVGLNLVMPEDWYVPMHDFDLHMKMIDYLHATYPTVHISLHAGELAMGLVPPEGLRSHIRDSIKRGHAERIGHGVSVMYEDNPLGLLKEMSDRNVLVEICLTSNALILGVDGSRHPLPTYISHGVPVALATDDEGVSRSDMTQEYLRAIETYNFSYSQMKHMARQSLEHSFLAGPSLWQESGHFQTVAACAGDQPGNSKASPGCEKFLASSDRARVQWELEKQFVKFEKAY